LDRDGPEGKSTGRERASFPLPFVLGAGEGSDLPLLSSLEEDFQARGITGHFSICSCRTRATAFTLSYRGLHICCGIYICCWGGFQSLWAHCRTSLHRFLAL